MNPLPKGTTQEQWDQYAKDNEAHEARMQAKKPKTKDFKTAFEYESAHSEWLYGVVNGCTE